jgi:type II secretory pathway component GspD/PulD (secretin)
MALKQLRSRMEVETLGEPEITTLSGRQTQLRATQVISVVTNFCRQAVNGTSRIVPQTENVETGPVLGTLPRVLPDGYTIELPVITSVVEFLGYAQSTNPAPAYISGGQEMDMPAVSPQFRMQSTTNSVNLFDTGFWTGGQPGSNRRRSRTGWQQAQLAEPAPARVRHCNHH